MADPETTDLDREAAIKLVDKHFPGDGDALDAFFPDLVRALKKARREGREQARKLSDGL